MQDHTKDTVRKEGGAWVSEAREQQQERSIYPMMKC